MGTTPLISAASASNAREFDASSLVNSETVDPRNLRNALGRFATGVTVVTTQTPSGKLEGLTANSFSALSLDPPLVLWCIRRSAPSLPGFLAASGFAVNVLGSVNRKLAATFATPRRQVRGRRHSRSGCAASCPDRQHRRLRMPDGKHDRGRRPPDHYRPRCGDLASRRRAAGLPRRRILRSGAALPPDRASAAPRLSRVKFRR